MFKKIMVPVDLAHAEKLERSLQAAADISKLYDIAVTYVGVTASAPGPLGHNQEEYSGKLKAFAENQAHKHGIATDFRSMVSHDPAVDVDDALTRAVEDTGCDLVVMATHLPGIADHFWPSRGGRLATHTDASVFLVRG